MKIESYVSKTKPHQINKRKYTMLILEDIKNHAYANMKSLTKIDKRPFTNYIILLGGGRIT